MRKTFVALALLSSCLYVSCAPSVSTATAEAGILKSGQLWNYGVYVSDQMRIDSFPIAQSKGVPGVYTGSHFSLGTTYMIVVKSKQALIVTDRLKGVSEDMRLICIADASASRSNTFTGKAYPIDNSEWSSVLAIASGVNTGEADAEEFYGKALAKIQKQESAGVCDFRL